MNLLRSGECVVLGFGRPEAKFHHSDMKGSAVVEDMTPIGPTFYAGICSWTLARAHARSGDAVALAEYLGKSDKFDRSITDFSQRYAEQNERDYKAFGQAIRSGRLQATESV